MFRAKHQYFKPPRSRLRFREETQNYAKRNRSQIFFLSCFVYCIRGQNLLKPRPDWSPLGVTKSFSHAQMEHPRLFHMGVPTPPPPPRGSGRSFSNDVRVVLTDLKLLPNETEKQTTGKRSSREPCSKDPLRSAI